MSFTQILNAQLVFIPLGDRASGYKRRRVRSTEQFLRVLESCIPYMLRCTGLLSRV